MNTVILADAGAPMILIEWPLMFCALIPIILIETEVARRRLALPYGKAFKGTARANLLSTAAGVPLAWGIMLIIEFATMFPLAAAAQEWHWSPDSPIFYLAYVLGVAWVGPPTTSWWPVTLAAALLLIPTFFLSVVLERRSCRKSWRDVDKQAVDRTIWFANIWSYVLLFAAVSGLFVWQIHKGAETAPPLRRAQEQSVDLAYLNNVAIPSADASVSPKLAKSAEQFESYLPRLQAFLRDVQQGKIPVVKRIDTGRWQSSFDKENSWVRANFANKIGGLTYFEEYPNGGRRLYRFEFNSAGYMIRAEVADYTFQFDDHGRLYHWHGDKLDYWGKPPK